MFGVIFKLSYNEGMKEIRGGICGSCFSINSNYIITANHFLSKSNFKPNEGFRYCQYWVLSKDFVYEIFPEYFKEFPEMDVTLIKNLKEENKIIPLKVSEDFFTETECYAKGFLADAMPLLDKTINKNKIEIHKCMNLKNFEVNSKGKIFLIGKVNMNSKDVKIKDKKIIGCDYGGIKGMSGGPLVKKDTGEVIGMMSFGLPFDKKIKENLFAVSIDEIKIIEENLK